MGTAQTLEAPETEPFVCPPDHPHGKNQTCRTHGCKCKACGDAHAARARKRRRDIAYGRPTSDMVDAGPARDHIQALRESGMGVRTIAQLAGLSYASTGAIVWGVREFPPTQKLREAHAKAILAVRAEIDVLAPDAKLTAVPTRRRLQALACRGWTWVEIGRHCGADYRVLARILDPKRKWVEARTARAISAAYDELWDQEPPVPNAYVAAKVELTRKRAKDRGWVPPLGWDDIDNDPEPPTDATDVTDEPYIDDVAVARALAGTPTKLTRPERIEATRIAHARRWSDPLIAERIGVDPKTVSRIRVDLGLAAWPVEEAVTRTEAAAA